MATPAPQFEPESLNELTRFVQYMFHGFEKQLTEMSSKIDGINTVTPEQHRADLEQLRGEHKELEQNFEDYKTRQTAQTRWVIGSVVIPVLIIAITAILMLNGYG